MSSKSKSYTIDSSWFSCTKYDSLSRACWSPNQLHYYSAEHFDLHNFGLGWKLRCSAALIDRLCSLWFRRSLVCAALRFVICFMLLLLIRSILFGWRVLHAISALKFPLFMVPKQKLFLMLLCQAIYPLGSAFLYLLILGC